MSTSSTNHTSETLRAPVPAVDTVQLYEEQLRKALARERELSELKSRFLLVAAHEFRTPLATISLALWSLRKQAEQLALETMAQKFERIQTAIAQMTELIDDLLALGKSAEGQLDFNPSPLNLDALCRGFVEEMQTPAHTLIFTQQGTCGTAMIDLRLLRYIIPNLLSNAIKYSPSGSQINVDLICNDRQAVIRVKDRGIGIPEKDLKHLFEIFHRAANVETIAGTGLGLAIAKNAVEAHGGKISVESQVGVGTVFTVTLPLTRPAA